jgi:hypothetical protein
MYMYMLCTCVYATAMYILKRGSARWLYVSCFTGQYFQSTLTNLAYYISVSVYV